MALSRIPGNEVVFLNHFSLSCLKSVCPTSIGSRTYKSLETNIMTFLASKTVLFMVKFDQNQANVPLLSATLRYETKHHYICTGMEPDAGSMRSIEKRRSLSRILAISPRFSLRTEDLRPALSNMEGCSAAGNRVPQRGQDR